MDRVVVIDCFPDAVARYTDRHAVVAVDVIRARTTVVTAVASGRRCHPVGTVEEAADVAGSLQRPLLAGELGGIVPDGFDLDNSPAQLAGRNDWQRPLVLLSSTGTRVIRAARDAKHSYVASLRNWSATAMHLLAHPAVALIGAGTGDEFREEDQLCCAWIAGW